MEIEDRLLTINQYSRSGEKKWSTDYIVVHWVGNANTSAIANRNYFENLKDTHSVYASSHYIIGLNGEIIRCIPDDEVAFHSGNYSMNHKSIGIEDCHPDWDGKFNDYTYNSLVELTASLCNQYGIDIVLWELTGICFVCFRSFYIFQTKNNCIITAIFLCFLGNNNIRLDLDYGYWCQISAFVEYLCHANFLCNQTFHTDISYLGFCY